MFTIDELVMLRSLTDDIEVKGSSAMSLVRLQLKLDAEIQDAQRERFAPPPPPAAEPVAEATP